MVHLLSCDEVLLSTLTEPSLMFPSLLTRGLYIALASKWKSVFWKLTQIYLNVSRIPPVTDATIIRSKIIE